MDLDKYIRSLYKEMKELDRAIARLEAKTSREIPRVVKRRGRTTMSPEERLEVSRRMSAYWAARRENKDDGPGPDNRTDG